MASIMSLGIGGAVFKYLEGHNFNFRGSAGYSFAVVFYGGYYSGNVGAVFFLFGIYAFINRTVIVSKIPSV